MPRIVTSLHDRAALAAACCELGLPPPRAWSGRPGAARPRGQAVRVPGTSHPIVIDLQSGQVAYHTQDNDFGPFDKIVRFLLRCYAVGARRRYAATGRGRGLPAGRVA
jgi:hypothetical protein